MRTLRELLKSTGYFQRRETAVMLARCIHEVEARTEAEIVLIIRNSSGMYRDVDFLVGSLGALALLLYKLFSEVEFHPVSVPLPLILTFGLLARLSQAAGHYGPRRWLTTEARRTLQVRNSASGRFYGRGIDQAANQTGILIYFSALERRVELLAGIRARAAISPKIEDLRHQLQSACTEVRTVHASVIRIAEFLRTLGVYLGQVLPPGDGDKINCLDDTPELPGEGEAQ